jgi:hypothetical protein
MEPPKTTGVIRERKVLGSARKSTKLLNQTISG